jgi:hypothetical protein
MKKLIITAICGMSLLSSCVVPNPNVQNESGFEVDTETISLMIATKLLEDDMTYEDELVRISDKLAQMTVDEVITVDELKKSIEDSIIQYCSKSRRTKVLVAFDSNAYATVSGEQHVDVSYGSVSTISKTVNYDANDYVCVAVPTCAGFKSIECWDAGGQMKVDNYFAEVETTTREINGCTTEFKVYKSKGAAKGANSIIVKVIK